MSQIDSDARGDGKHHRMLAPVGNRRIVYNGGVVPRDPPAQFWLQIDSEALCRVHLDSPCPDQGKAGPVLFQAFSSKCCIQAEIALYAATHIDVKPGIGGEDPI